MKPTPYVNPSDKADKYILRFSRPGHRDQIKIAAIQAKRTLNQQLLFLIEAGEKATQAQGAQQ